MGGACRNRSRHHSDRPLLSVWYLQPTAPQFNKTTAWTVPPHSVGQPATTVTKEGALPRFNGDYLLYFAPGHRPIFILGAHSGLLNTDRPHVTYAIKQRTETINGSEVFAAVLFHHLQKKFSAGMPTKAVMIEPREPGQ